MPKKHSVDDSDLVEAESSSARDKSVQSDGDDEDKDEEQVQLNKDEASVTKIVEEYLKSPSATLNILSQIPRLGLRKKSKNAIDGRSVSGRNESAGDQESQRLVEIMKEMTLKIATDVGKQEASLILSSSLKNHNALVDETKLTAAILTALNAGDALALSKIIQTILGKLATGSSFWQRMDSQFYDILNESKYGFKINTAINIILVIIGITLIGNAIAYTWVKGATDAWSIFSGGIGIGALVTLFFYRSQNAITKAVANLSIIDMVFKSHYRAYESVTDYDYWADRMEPHRNVEELKSMIRVLEGTTKEHVKLIQQLQLVKETDEEEEAS